MIVDKEILKRVLVKWGIEAQIDMVHEEVGEFQSALNKYRRGRCEIKEVQEEIADCLMMFQQMRHYFGAEQVDFFIRNKTKRLEDRLADPEREVL